MTATIRLRMPNARAGPASGRGHAEVAGPSPNRTWGKRGRPFADFALLRYPVYLPMMRELAEQGDARGLEAIGAMAFPEATEALLELSKSQGPGDCVQGRGTSLGANAYHLFRNRPSRESYLADRSWRR